MARKIQSLEMLRAIAALLVVLYHAQTIFGGRADVIPFGGIFASGFRGVDLFFVLSGFIIAHVHAADIGRPERLSHYAFNRAARIYPSVWILTTFAGALYAAGFGGVHKAGKLEIWEVVANVLLLPQIGDALVNVTWTLKYELFFYAVFGVLIVNKKIGIGLLCTWQIAVLLGAFIASTETLGLRGFYLRSLCLEFSVGLACAWLVGRPVVIRALAEAPVQWGLTVAGVLAFVAGMALQSSTGVAGIPCALGAGAVIVGLTMLEQSGRMRVPPVLIWFGGASYAIYLVHYATITLFALLVSELHFVPLGNVVFAFAVVSGVAAGVAFDRWVDRPIQRWLRRQLKPLLFGVARGKRSLSA